MRLRIPPGVRIHVSGYVEDGNPDRWLKCSTTFHTGAQQLRDDCTFVAVYEGQAIVLRRFRPTSKTSSINGGYAVGVPFDTVDAAVVAVQLGFTITEGI